MSNTLTLSSTGPTPNPLEVPNSDKKVDIVNNLGSEVSLTLSPPGFLNPSTGSTLTVPTTGWSGTAGSTGDYSYADPTSTKKATRNGRIKVT